MGYRRVSQTGAWKITLAMKEEIKEKFGEKAITEAKLRLCKQCKQMSCYLLPICTDGKDCPYFKPGKEKV